LNNPTYILKRAAGIFLVALFILQCTNKTIGQNSIGKFFKLNCPEKKWVIFHPFIAKTVYNISINASEKAKQLLTNKNLDGDLNGGQLDAFRHAYWMASITQKYGWRTARSLGKAHEKGNYRDFKKHQMEDGALPDEASCQMDFLNNDAGIELGKSNQNLTDNDLQKKIIDLINSGKLFVIKKDSKGNFLTCENEIIKIEELKGNWQNKKCIVASNYHK
jgi:hypothetical protein